MAANYFFFPSTPQIPGEEGRTGSDSGRQSLARDGLSTWHAESSGQLRYHATPREVPTEAGQAAAAGHEAGRLPDRGRRRR